MKLLARNRSELVREQIALADSVRSALRTGFAEELALATPDGAAARALELLSAARRRPQQEKAAVALAVVESLGFHWQHGASAKLDRALAAALDPYCRLLAGELELVTQTTTIAPSSLQVIEERLASGAALLEHWTEGSTWFLRALRNARLLHADVATAVVEGRELTGLQERTLAELDWLTRSLAGAGYSYATVCRVQQALKAASLVAALAADEDAICMNLLLEEMVSVHRAAVAGELCFVPALADDAEPVLAVASDVLWQAVGPTPPLTAAGTLYACRLSHGIVLLAPSTAQAAIARAGENQLSNVLMHELVHGWQDHLREPCVGAAMIVCEGGTELAARKLSSQPQDGWSADPFPLLSYEGYVQLVEALAAVVAPGEEQEFLRSLALHGSDSNLERIATEIAGPLPTPKLRRLAAELGVLIETIVADGGLDRFGQNPPESFRAQAETQLRAFVAAQRASAGLIAA